MKKYDNIPGFPGYYISKRGHLWSHRKGSWRRLKPHLNKLWGRYQCLLTNNQGKKVLCKISRLVALAWIPNPDNLPVVMHLDDNPSKDYDDVNYFLEKLIADEEHHVKLLKEVSGKEKSKGVTVIIK